jgi:hypothetical protein
MIPAAAARNTSGRENKGAAAETVSGIHISYPGQASAGRHA